MVSSLAWLAPDQRSRLGIHTKATSKTKKKRKTIEVPFMADAKSTKSTKVKKKHWAPILAPKSFENMVIGEAHVTENEELLAKSVTTNLMVLTDDPRKQGYNVRFDVKEVKEGKAHTQVIAIEMTPSAVKRLIRRGRDKVDDSFVVRIGGGRMIRIKPTLVTNTKASKAAQTEIRMTVRKRLRDHYAKMRFDDIVKEIIEMKTQRMLRDLCGKTHPLRSADIRQILIIPKDRKLTEEMEALLEQEVAEEDARRAQLASAVAAAGVGEETPAPALTGRGSRKPRKKELSPQEVEEAEAGKSVPTEGPEEPGV
jgi:ribosomal protein S3AE